MKFRIAPKLKIGYVGPAKWKQYDFDGTAEITEWSDNYDGSWKCKVLSSNNTHWIKGYEVYLIPKCFR